LFQTGYLTIESATKSLVRNYYLKIPNLEVAEALEPLELSVKEALGKSPLAKKHSIAMLDYLFARNAEGFQESLTSYLSNIPYDLHVFTESYYSTLFIYALILAGQAYSAQHHVGDGRIDIYLRSKSGEHYVIEIKYLKMKKPIGKVSEAEAKEQMQKLLDEAKEQIDETRYAQKFLGSGKPVYAVSLVFARHTDVLVKFQQVK
jgi:hypothetical protein